MPTSPNKTDLLLQCLLLVLLSLKSPLLLP